MRTLFLAQIGARCGRRGRLIDLAPSRPRSCQWALVGLLVTALLNVGCITTGPVQWVRNGFKVGPNYCKPPAPVADEWIEGNDSRAQSPPPADGLWWDVFQDPILNSLICQAYQQNPNLRAVGTRVLQAQARQAIAVGSLFPQLQQLNGSYSNVNLSQNTFNNPSILKQLAKGAIPPGLNIGNNYPVWTAAPSLNWELDFWGRYRRGIESANGNMDASVENYDAALVTLLADVATNYVQYRVAQQRIKIAHDNLKDQEQLVALAEQQFQVGTATRRDVEQLRTLMEQTRSTIPFLHIARGQANDILCILVGVPPHDLEERLGPGPELGSEPMPNSPRSIASGIPAELLRRRPDIRSAERQVAAQSAQIGVAEADLYPTIYINGTLGWQAADASKLFESSSFFGTITPQFQWNILNYGRILNNVHLQEARTQELIATYQNDVLVAAQQVQTSLRGFLRSQEQASALTRSAAAAVAAAKIEEQLFTEVKADVNRLFTLANSRLQQQDNLAVSQGGIALNLINTYRALGGGWEIRYQEGLSDQSGTTYITSEPVPLVPAPEPTPNPAAEPQP